MVHTCSLLRFHQHTEAHVQQLCAKQATSNLANSSRGTFAEHRLAGNQTRANHMSTFFIAGAAMKSGACKFAMAATEDIAKRNKTTSSSLSQQD